MSTSPATDVIARLGAVATGVVCVPGSMAAEVAGIAEACARDDLQAEKEIGDGLSFSEAMRRFRRI